MCADVKADSERWEAEERAILSAQPSNGNSYKIRAVLRQRR